MYKSLTNLNFITFFFKLSTPLQYIILWLGSDSFQNKLITYYVSILHNEHNILLL